MRIIVELLNGFLKIKKQNSLKKWKKEEMYQNETNISKRESGLIHSF